MQMIANFPCGNIQNKILLIPAAAVGTFLGLRVVAGALAFSLKDAGQVANFFGINTLGENLNASSDQLAKFATRSFDTELKVCLRLASLAVLGVGVATLLTPPEASSTRIFADFIGLTTPSPSRLRILTNSMGLTTPASYYESLPDSFPYKLMEHAIKINMELPHIRILRGLSPLQDNPIKTLIGEMFLDFSELYRTTAFRFLN